MNRGCILSKGVVSSNIIYDVIELLQASCVAQKVKHLPAKQETQVQSLGQEDSPGEGNGNPLQYSCLENAMEREAWQTTVHEVAKSQTHMRD